MREKRGVGGNRKVWRERESGCEVGRKSQTQREKERDHWGFVKSWGLSRGRAITLTSIFPRLGLKLVKLRTYQRTSAWDLLRTNAVMC